MNIFMVRHGQTKLNGEKRYIGHMDEPISELGKLQASAVAAAMAENKVDIIFSSPLVRARETAEEISQALGNVPIILLDGLKEINFGEWEGLTYQEIAHRYKQVNDWLIEPSEVEIPGGEKWHAFEYRVERAFEQVLEYKKNACVVSHGGPLRLIIGKVILPKSKFCYIAPAILTINHGSLSLIKRTNGHLSIEYINEVCHLKESSTLVDNFEIDD